MQPVILHPAYGIISLQESFTLNFSTLSSLSQLQPKQERLQYRWPPWFADDPNIWPLGQCLQLADRHQGLQKIPVVGLVLASYCFHRTTNVLDCSLARHNRHLNTTIPENQIMTHGKGLRLDSAPPAVCFDQLVQ